MKKKLLVLVLTVAVVIGCMQSLALADSQWLVPNPSQPRYEESNGSLKIPVEVPQRLYGYEGDELEVPRDALIPSGGKWIGGWDGGEYVEYDIKINKAGTYGVELFICGQQIFDLYVDGELAASYGDGSTFYGTNTWDTLEGITQDVDFTAGNHTLKVQLRENFFASLGGWVTLTYKDGGEEEKGDGDVEEEENIDNQEEEQIDEEGEEENIEEDIPQAGQSTALPYALAGMALLMAAAAVTVTVVEKKRA